MINVRNLRFDYGNEFQLSVDEITICQGERVAWLGASGSGKTTLLQLVAGILEPKHGAVEICGARFKEFTPRQRREFRISNIGLVFQEFELFDYLNVLDNVLLAYRISPSLKIDAEVRERARDLIDQVGLKDFTHRRPGQLSHGQRQRIAICRALATGPKIILADEPTANLDESNRDRALDLLEEYVQNMDATLVVVTHDQSVAKRFDRVMKVSVNVEGDFSIGSDSSIGETDD